MTLSAWQSVFTGLRYGPGGNGTQASPILITRRCRVHAPWHSDLEKSFLGTTIPAGTRWAMKAFSRAHRYAIFAHPNVAPFVSRQLIQRFTHSSPPPEYVERVATAFESRSLHRHWRPAVRHRSTRRSSGDPGRSPARARPVQRTNWQFGYDCVRQGPRTGPQIYPMGPKAFNVSGVNCAE